MMYVCNPLRNTACGKTGCLFCFSGECFSTLEEKYAVRCEGKPVSFPEGLYEAVKGYMVPRWKGGRRMSDYISREAVLEEMKTWVCCSEGERKMLEITKKWLKGYPAADVVEVVRCKNCKYYRTTFLKRGMTCWREDADGLIAAYACLPEDFCSYGERREDG